MNKDKIFKSAHYWAEIKLKYKLKLLEEYYAYLLLILYNPVYKTEYIYYVADNLFEKIYFTGFYAPELHELYQSQNNEIYLNALNTIKAFKLYTNNMPSELPDDFKLSNILDTNWKYRNIIYKYNNKYSMTWIDINFKYDNIISKEEFMNNDVLKEYIIYDNLNITVYNSALTVLPNLYKYIMKYKYQKYNRQITNWMFLIIHFLYKAYEGILVELTKKYICYDLDESYKFIDDELHLDGIIYEPNHKLFCVENITNPEWIYNYIKGE